MSAIVTPPSPSVASANAARFAEQHANAAAEPTPPVDANRLRILVVEDDADAMTATLEALQLLGHWATGVRSAESAITRYLRGAFDLLMLDVGLPGLSGRDLAAKLMQTERVPVLFASGEPEPVPPPEGTIWLRKPYGIDDLALAIARARSGLVRNAA